LQEDKLAVALPRLARASVEDVFTAIGRGEMVSGDVIRAVFPDYREEASKSVGGANGSGWFGVAGAESMKFKVPGQDGAASSIPIRGISDDVPVKFAPGGAVPGDRIVGITTPGEGITIYPIQSPALSSFDEEPWRWLDVRWDMDERAPRRFPARLLVSVYNEPGGLAEITRVIADTDANIDNITMLAKTQDFREIMLDIEVWDLKHLNAIISGIRAKAMVERVERIVG
jgi:GTP pyrophosphokinase